MDYLEIWGDDEMLRAELQSLSRRARRLAPDDAEDIAVDALLATIRHLKNGRPIANPPAYARGIAFNLSFDACIRRRRIDVLPSCDVIGPVIDATYDELVAADDVAARLKQLPTQTRRVAQLRFHLDLSNKRIGELLGIAPSTVSTHLARARLLLTEPHEPEKTDGP